MSAIGSWLDRHVIRKYVDKPGLDLPKDWQARELTVDEVVDGKRIEDTFVQRRGSAPQGTDGTTKPFSMIPNVPGGIKEGDIVLRGNSKLTTFESGFVTTLANFLKTGKWQRVKSQVSHAGVVVRGDDGKLMVAQMVSGDTPPELAAKLTKPQKLAKATFLRLDTISDFFESKDGTPFTQSTVMRPKDQAEAQVAARRAKRYVDTQVEPDGTTHPWYAKLPHTWAPGDRGGVCSTFVDLAFGEKFKLPLNIPTTPEQFVDHPDLEMVGDRTITEIEAVAA